MNNRTVNVIKWILMLLGVMFLLEIFIIAGAFLALVKYANIDLNDVSFDEIIYKVTEIR